MKDGDNAGLAALQGNYGLVGVKAVKKGLRKMVVSKKDKDGFADFRNFSKHEADLGN